MNHDSGFNHNQKYRCRVVGASWGRSNQKRTPFFSLTLEVVGGEMEGSRLIREVYFSGRGQDGNVKSDEDRKKMIASICSEFNSAFGLNIMDVDLTKLSDNVLHKECCAQAEVRTDPKGNIQTRAARLMSVVELIAGGIETEVAAILGNKVTTPPDKDAYADQY